MARKHKRDLTVEEQLARGPMDLPFLMLVMILLGIGLIMMFSASYATAYYDSKVADPLYYIKRQAMFAVVGVAVMYVVSKINYQTFRWMSVPALIFSIILLLLVFTPLGRSHNGARRWLYLGVEFQPSEIAKIAVILFFAARLCKRDSRKPLRYKNRTFTGRMLNRLERIGFLELVPYIAVLGTVLLLVLLERHMSGTISVMVGAAVVLFAAGINIWWFIAGGAAVGSLLAFIMLATPYMNARIDLWLDPWGQRQGNGYQTVQSLLAMGSGGLLGLGLGNSRQKHLFVPEPQNDFIFSIVCEELGFVGACAVVGLFVLLLCRGITIAAHAPDRFGALLVVGFVVQVALQAVLNMAVVTNTIPNTGISLPFFSSGGTSLMMLLGEMGVVLGVSRGEA